jgi:hypothetical protein
MCEIRSLTFLEILIFMQMITSLEQEAKGRRISIKQHRATHRGSNIRQEREKGGPVQGMQ